MSAPIDSNLALFCDFENIALGVRDAKYAKFDINKIIERLLVKGSIVVKKAYCDWGRYKDFKATMHEAAFELIDIPHVRQSGKNSADIRLVVDAMDLSASKDHIDTFVIVSGDSDFSPLVAKLKENGKYVMGVGMKESTSKLLADHCDEFLYYEELEEEQVAIAAETGDNKMSKSSHHATTRRVHACSSFMASNQFSPESDRPSSAAKRFCGSTSSSVSVLPSRSSQSPIVLAMPMARTTVVLSMTAGENQPFGVVSAVTSCPRSSSRRPASSTAAAATGCIRRFTIPIRRGDEEGAERAFQELAPQIVENLGRFVPV